MNVRRPSRSKPVTLAAVRTVLLSFPGVEEGPCYGTPGFRVRGKLLARLREDGEALAVKCGHDERDLWMQIDPATFFTTDHYRGYPTVLVRLSSVDPSALREVAEQAWRRSAPKRAVEAYDRRRDGTRGRRSKMIREGGGQPSAPAKAIIFALEEGACPRTKFRG